MKLFGEEAIEYRNSGRIPLHIPDEKVKKEKIREKEKEVDKILDQISVKGMKSLNKKQKEFLVNYSKENNRPS